MIYEIGQVFRVFGSRLDEYSPESIAAAHDACAIVMPHAYDAGPDQEVAQFQLASSIGADGAQTNQPALIVAAAGEPVGSRRLTRREHVAGAKVCLVNAANGLGFPGKTVRLVKDELSTDLVTGLDGCVGVPTVNWRGASVSFAGDGAVHASTGRITPSTG
ncbi:hypothetical protein [Actinopolymorpha sp. B17G11]|uniref:hypothetical protein n=1 Tax=Actinopolymorpha sp. B17G11 TaxID=3160861 RepID=UPI0032E519E3